MQTLPPGLRALAAYPQWIICQLVPDPQRLGKTQKYPVHPDTLHIHDAHDPAIWLTQPAVESRLAELGPDYRLGSVFTAADPFFFLDIDGALQADGTWSPLATRLCQQFAGAYVEVSQSGKGLHIIGSAAVMPEHACKNVPLGLELYTEGRFVALTGLHASGDAGVDATLQLAQLTADYFPPRAGGQLVAPEWTDGPREGYGGPADDDELIRMMRASKGNLVAEAFSTGGGSASFEALWTADADLLGRAYPDDYGSRLYDASSADAGLAMRLAFWTGCDCERIERLMRQSALARPKWDQHASYLRRTIMGAVARCAQIYEGKKRTDAPAVQLAPPSVPPATRTGEYQIAPLPGGKGNTVVEVAGMVERHIQVAWDEFKKRPIMLSQPPWESGSFEQRCIEEADLIELQAWLQQQMLKPPSEAVYNGVMMMAKRNRHHPVRNYLDGLAWDGVPRLDGWLSDYLSVKDTEYSRTVGPKFLLSAVARIYEPGCQVDYMLILEGIQGAQKSSVIRALVPDPQWFIDEVPDITSKDAAIQLDGAWIVEVAELDAWRRSENSAQKKFVTRRVDRYRPVHEKMTIDVPRQCVFIGTVNPINGHGYLKDPTGNRRYWPARCGQCHPGALAENRDQLWAEAVVRYRTGEIWYVPKEDERRIIAPEQRARQETVSWEEELQEAIAEGRAGFAKGWISSKAVTRLLEQLGLARSVSLSHRAYVIRELGYEYHPALPDGRVNNPTIIDQGKPRLFIHADSPYRNLTVPADVVRVYQECQEV